MTNDLIARMEALTEPSREVDAEIMAACFDWAKNEPQYLAYYCVGDEDPIYFHAPIGSPYQKNPPPKLTASLDAAVALAERVLPGCNATIDILPPSATIWDEDHGASDACYQVKGATPSIALCIAVLKALKERETTDEPS